MPYRFADSCQQNFMTYTIAVCTVKNSWWWAEEISETCRGLFQKYIWEISASIWFYYTTGKEGTHLQQVSHRWCLTNIGLFLRCRNTEHVQILAICRFPTHCLQMWRESQKSPSFPSDLKVRPVCKLVALLWLIYIYSLYGIYGLSLPVGQLWNWADLTNSPYDRVFAEVYAKNSVRTKLSLYRPGQVCGPQNF